MARDYYDILGVARNADGKAIKSAFRKLAKQYHPDRNAGDKTAEQRFKDISQAYDVLNDPQKRAAYDQFGEQGAQMGAGFGGGFASSMSDIFEELFGGRRGGGARRGGYQTGAGQGADLEYVLPIDLKYAFTGGEQDIVFTAPVLCETCKGEGAAPGSGLDRCEMCEGSGQIRHRQGFFTLAQTCPSCGGGGEVIAEPCAVCGGRGQSEKRQRLRVQIPAGIEDGQTLRLAGKGGGGRPAGDLFVRVQLARHEIFTRDGADLHCEVPVSFTAAALGGESALLTLDGKKLSFRIPEGCQNGYVLRLRGQGMPRAASRGMPRASGGRGDILLTLQVETPVALNAKQKAALQKFADMTGEENSPRSAGFFARAKSFFDSLRA